MEKSPLPWRQRSTSKYQVVDAKGAFVAQFYRIPDVEICLRSVAVGSDAAIPSDLLELLRGFVDARRKNIGIRESNNALLAYCERLMPQKVTV